MQLGIRASKHYVAVMGARCSTATSTVHCDAITVGARCSAALQRAKCTWLLGGACRQPTQRCGCQQHSVTECGNVLQCC